MIRRTALAALPLAFLVALAPVAWSGTAAAKPSTQFTDQDKAKLTQVETYLNGIQTLKSQFQQINPDGSLVRGTFQLKRPGKMRIDYDPPNKNFIVADGHFVYFWDAEAKEQSNAPIGSTMADFILRPDLHLSGDVTVTSMDDSAGVLEVTLVQTKDPGLGRLTLMFQEQPFTLKRWRVLDAQGATTEVALLDPQAGVSLDDSQFYFRDPSRRKERD
ncbi:LolA family protein [Nitrospirillum pindoramense]|uniref:Outer membrane lipoprotein-sorting protein n=1 Tax=Nitrospirillum amazonense TaxID=28077 RepID=A0A560GKK9_9PROT|nr:outer membrane lipoprotein carrier protein LolA [Nitrospirillum amazonense]TWB34090.1 outer membrane lipoprotein-sorting protein [Nitrospirillum amazonense]